MTFNWQSIAAPVIVLLAVGYLYWDTRRRKGSGGCGSAGECACPRPKLPSHLKKPTP